jgi:acyl-CoA thioester hydrolase
MKFSHSFLVKPEHLDAQNHVNNVVYVQWIQDVAVAHWQKVASLENQEKLTWFLLRHEIDFKHQAFENEGITVTTWVGRSSKVRCDRFTEVKCGETLLVSAKSIWCLLDANTKKPTKISEELRKQFAMI